MRHSIIVFILVILCGCAEISDPFRSEVEERVAYNLKDPDSAEFRDVDLYPDAQLACGEVNGNNSYGAKSGFSGFVYDTGVVYFEGDYGYLDGFSKCTEQIKLQTDEIVKGLPPESRKKLEEEFAADREKYELEEQ